MGKKLVRGSSWEARDFYLGIQLTLSTFSAVILFVFETLRSPAGSATSAITPLLFGVVVFFIYVWLLTLHQDWEHLHPRPKGQILRLGCVSNLVGIFLFAAFVFMIKGIR
jgi:hypothetical protein